MLIIPAIDLKDGCVVRLVKGDFKQRTVYSKDPLKTARHWVKQGAGLIHVVDLDGAASGRPKNIQIAKEIAAGVSAGVQFGGGVRDIKTIKELLDAGIQRVVLGTRAIEDKKFLRQVSRNFGKKVIISIDAQGGQLMTRGWVSGSAGKGPIEFVQELIAAGFRQVIFTDISKDGTLKGPNIKAIKELLKKAKVKVIASGGVSSLDDLRRLKALEKSGLTGVIVGKALYEAKFTLAEALKLA